MLRSLTHCSNHRVRERVTLVDPHDRQEGTQPDDAVSSGGIETVVRSGPSVDRLIRRRRESLINTNRLLGGCTHPMVTALVDDCRATIFNGRTFAANETSV